VIGGAVFETAFRRAELGKPAAFTIRDPGGGEHVFDPATWCRDHLPGDTTLIEPCTGPTLDVGCGPGRLAHTLTRSGRPALGIDISAAAVRLARRRGAVALRRDVFGPLPGAGRWRHVLLADGNIGIGGDPDRLLRRCRDLVGVGGQVHTELAPPGAASWSGTATGPAGTTMPWASVAVDDLAALATAASMRVLDTRTEAGRWFATLTPK
jgi:SAM-dependent methyltransferase